MKKIGVLSAVAVCLVLSQAATAAVPNLVGWWQMENNLNDSSGAGNHGTSIDGEDGAITFNTPAPNATAGSFAAVFPNDDGFVGGAGDAMPTYIDAGTSSTMDPGTQGTRQFSIGGWIRPSNQDPGHSVVLSRDGAYKFQIRNRGEGQGFSPYLEIRKAAGFATEVRSTQALTVGQWAHVVAVYDGDISGTEVDLYVNGNLTPDFLVPNGAANSLGDVRASASAATTLGDCPSGLGGCGRPIQTPGALDDAFLFVGTALNANDVSVIYNQGVGAVPEPSALMLAGLGLMGIASGRWKKA